MLTASRYRFYWMNFGIPLACAVAVFLMFDMTSIDIAFNNYFFDPVTQTYPLDQVHLFEKNHPQMGANHSELDRRNCDYRCLAVVSLATPEG